MPVIAARDALERLREGNQRFVANIRSQETLPNHARRMQLAAGQLDPTLNPFEVARSFGVRNALQQLRGFIDHQQIFYTLQKGKARVNRILESVESLARAMPGSTGTT